MAEFGDLFGGLHCFVESAEGGEDADVNPLGDG